MVLLACMEGTSRSFDAREVREQRAINKVFGLRDPEKWSGQKQLVDFVDDLFSRQRRASLKFTRPVSVCKAVAMKQC